MRVNRAVFIGLVVALFLSLLGNIFYGGVMVGHAAKPLPAQPEVVALGPILKSLPEADRRVMRRNFIQRREEIQKTALAAKTSAAALRQALEADPFDPDRMKAALADYQRDFLALRGLEQDIFWDGVQRMSPQARKQLAESPAFDRALK